MNDFYKNKAAIPREARNAKDIRSALEAWRDKRLLNVVEACGETEDPYRKYFSMTHQGLVNTLNEILEKDDEEIYELAQEWLDLIHEHFFSPAVVIVAAQREAIGLCGAELQKIVEHDYDTKS
jgi:hypothetical protein